MQQHSTRPDKATDVRRVVRDQASGLLFDSYTALLRWRRRHDQPRASCHSTTASADATIHDHHSPPPDVITMTDTPSATDLDLLDPDTDPTAVVVDADAILKDVTWPAIIHDDRDGEDDGRDSDGDGDDDERPPLFTDGGQQQGGRFEGVQHDRGRPVGSPQGRKVNRNALLASLHERGFIGITVTMHTRDYALVSLDDVPRPRQEVARSYFYDWDAAYAEPAVEGYDWGVRV